nr:hypothetical protein [Tanacetum cinerariifolium]
MAYVTYHVEANNNAGFYNSLIAWETPWNQASLDTHIKQNSCVQTLCEVYNDGKSDDNDKIYNNLNGSARQVAVRKKGMWMTVTIESDTSPFFQAHFNLDALPICIELHRSVNLAFIGELELLAYKFVPGKMAEFMKEIQDKDIPNLMKLQILGREFELRVREKDLFIEKLKGNMDN